jgi:hypothetical protein
MRINSNVASAYYWRSEVTGIETNVAGREGGLMVLFL